MRKRHTLPKVAHHSPALTPLNVAFADRIDAFGDMRRNGILSALFPDMPDFKQAYIESGRRYEESAERIVDLLAADGIKAYF